MTRYARAPARGRSSCGWLRLGKQVYHTEPALALDDGLGLQGECPLSLDVKRKGYASLNALMRCPVAL